MNNYYSTLCLKVLKGVNEGAIANFSSKLVVVGSSHDCDVILSGFTSIEKRFELNFEAGASSIKVLNSSIYIDGIKVRPTEDFIPFDLYQLISFEGCCVSIGERNTIWPSSVNNKKYQDPRNQQKSIYSGLRDYVRFSRFQHATESQKIIFTLLLFALVAGIFLLNTTGPSKSSIAPSSLTIVDQKKKSGYKKNNFNNVEKMAYGLLQTYGVNRINLHLNNDGVLFAKGYVGSSVKWEKAKTSILEDIDSVKRIDTSEIETFRERVIELNEMLQEKRIKRNLSVKTNEERNLILVSGELTNNAVQTWNDIQKYFINSYTNEPAIKSNIINIEEKLKLLIRGVSIGKTRFLISKSGKKYMVGSELGGGFKVIAIEIDKITLSYKGNNIDVFYSKEVERKSNII